MAGEFIEQIDSTGVLTAAPGPGDPRALTLRTLEQEITVPLGDGAAELVPGGPVWTETPRTDDKPLTTWDGSTLDRVRVPVFLDGHRAQTSVQADLDALLDLARGPDPEQPPDDFIATGPIPLSGGRFVMDPLEWGDGSRRGDGALIRQALTLILVEFNDPDVIGFVKRQPPKRHARHRRIYVTKKGDTLLKIAAKQLGDARRWREIVRLNPALHLRDPRKKIKPGTRLNLPPKKPTVKAAGDPAITGSGVTEA